MQKHQEIEKELEKSKDFLMVVEGKKDFLALDELGFKNIFILNENNKSLYEKIEQIEEVAGKRKICILTDFDKKGKQLYLLLKKELSQKNIKMDNTFRDILLREHISHIEGLSSFMEHKK